MVILCLVFLGIAILFSIRTAPFYIPTNIAQEFQFFHALVNTHYFLGFFYSHLRTLFFIAFRERGERRRRSIHMREKYQLVASHMHLD